MVKNQIDYTKMRANKKRHIVKCPDCGKNGQLHKYTNGSAMIVHTSHIELGMFENIDKDCYFKKWEA